MALSINTNISSLTAQRAIADSKNDLETAMERLSTGFKINSASDDALNYDDPTYDRSDKRAEYGDQKFQ